jgi:cytochrome c oxidase subunit 2
MLSLFLPEGISTYAKDIDTVFYVIFYITGFFFILVTVLLVWFLIKYRQRPGRRAIYSHGSTTLELVWTAVPAMIFIVLFLVSQATWARIKQVIPRGDVEVRLIAHQFGWKFQYPGPDGAFDTADDQTMPDELHVPVHQKVRVYLHSEDVIHSFFVPVMRIKQDVVPGREIVTWFEATKTGHYEIPCAELCGIGHSGMKGELIIHSDQDYQKWVKERWSSS